MFYPILLFVQSMVSSVFRMAHETTTSDSYTQVISFSRCFIHSPNQTRFCRCSIRSFSLFSRCSYQFVGWPMKRPRQTPTPRACLARSRYLYCLYLYGSGRGSSRTEILTPSTSGITGYHFQHYFYNPTTRFIVPFNFCLRPECLYQFTPLWPG